MKYVAITLKRSAKMDLGFKNTLRDGGFDPNPVLDFPLVAPRAHGHGAIWGGFCAAFYVNGAKKIWHRETSRPNILLSSGCDKHTSESQVYINARRRMEEEDIIWCCYFLI